MHEVFSEPHRRLVLYRLDAHTEPVSLATLVDEFRDEDEPVAPTSVVERWLLHEHVLPLERFGLVSYDPDADTVELSDEVVVTVAKPRLAECTRDVDRSEGT